MDVSIIIPYNIDRGFLKEAVKSAKQQKFTGTFEVIIQQGNKPVSANINDALKIAKGDYIKLCAEDDILLPGAIQVLYDYAVSGNYDLVCSNCINRGSEKEYEVKSHIPETISELAQCNTIHGLSTLFKNITLPEWNEILTCAEEFEIYLKMAKNGCRFGYVDAITGVYRLHETQKSGVYVNSDPGFVQRRREYIYNNIRDYYITSTQKINK
jgi:glycosyltransferase involved in cell wall biosynthesis